jgi:signal transduction histidine kinase
MKAILSSIRDGVMLEDTSGEFVPLNAAANAVLEEMANSFMASPLREVAADQSDQANEPVPRSIMSRRFQVGQKVLSVNSAAVRTDDGQHLGNVIVMRDVTAEVEAEHLKDAFVAHVSHELRTPLTAIKGYSDLLLVGPTPLDEQRRSFLQTIRHHTDDLIGMINGLLDFSEMESRGQLGLQRRPMSLAKLVQETASEWQSQMAYKGLKLEIKLPSDEECQINADAKRLRWAIVNLVRNAWQYTPSGGRVTLQLAARDGEVVLDVIDTGAGISPQDQQRLFTRFFRAGNVSADQVRGLGLGLYVTRAIVEAHGGRIDLVSAPGAGSTFSVVLPALEPRAAD